MKKYKVEWTKAASTDLLNIIEYIAEDGPASVRLPGARYGSADDGQLHSGGDANGAGDRRARRPIRSGDLADRCAPVCFLLRDHGRHHAAGRARQLRRRGHRKRESDSGRHSGNGLRDTHGRTAFHLDLQSGAAADPADS